MFLLVFPPVIFQFLPAGKKPLNFTSENFVKSAKAKMLAPVPSLPENYFEVVQFSAVVHEKEQKEGKKT